MKTRIPRQGQPCIHCPENQQSSVDGSEAPLVLAVENLSFAYPGQKPVLEKVSFHLHRGDFAGLIGANGTGKSTLVRLLLGLLEPLEGTIHYYLGSGRRNTTRRGGRHGIGYVAQRLPDWNPSFPATAAEVVAANLYAESGPFGRVGREGRHRVSEALERVGLGGQEKRLAGELSGGQLQRLHIARALVARPELLILDEPTSGIDQPTSRSLEELLERLARDEGLTVLLVSHDVSMITARTDRLLCLGLDGFFEHDAANPLSDDEVRRIFGADLMIHRAFPHGGGQHA
ncbi:MAG: ATP-binding cassette domain-containing protein [Bacillota bacterium]|nr:ATP-binding cassette domain-containing protein [Bacillota bacterium]